jgi:hypothetical protein
LRRMEKMVRACLSRFNGVCTRYWEKNLRETAKMGSSLSFFLNFLASKAWLHPPPPAAHLRTNMGSG